MMLIKRIMMLFRTEKKLLGRWNYKNTEKYMDWANADNCYQQFTKDIFKIEKKNTLVKITN